VSRDLGRPVSTDHVIWYTSYIYNWVILNHFLEFYVLNDLESDSRWFRTKNSASICLYFFWPGAPTTLPLFCHVTQWNCPCFPNREYQLFWYKLHFFVPFLFFFERWIGIAPIILWFGVALKNFWIFEVSHYLAIFLYARRFRLKCPIYYFWVQIFKCSTGVWDNRDTTYAFSLSSCVCVGVNTRVSASHYEYIILDPYIGCPQVCGHPNRI